MQAQGQNPHALFLLGVKWIPTSVTGNYSLEYYMKIKTSLLFQINVRNCKCTWVLRLGMELGGASPLPEDEPPPPSPGCARADTLWAAPALSPCEPHLEEEVRPREASLGTGHVHTAHVKTRSF